MGRRAGVADTILIEGHNLTLPTGAGIATYARNLAIAARNLGYSTKALVGVDRRLSRKDPILREIAFHDARPQGWSWSSMSVQAGLATSAVFGRPFGITPTEVRRTGLVIEPGESSVSSFDAMLAAPRLLDVARLHFGRYGVRANLNLDEVPSVFHATHPVPLRVRGCPNVHTVHDIIPLRLPYATLDDKQYFLRLVEHLCKKADHIVAVSEFSRRDIIRFFGIPESRITNTYQAVSIPEKLLAKSDDAVADELRNAFNLEMKEYFLFCGSLEPKKNISRLIDAYAVSGTRYPLVIAGALGWQCQVDVEKIQNERFLNYRIEDGRISADRHVRRLAYVPFAQLVALIRGARALLFPSLYEGFGLPVLEAMLLGTPVMTSNVSSLPEVAGEAALLVDPTDMDQIAAAIRKIDHDADLRAELSANGRERAKFFSPEAYRLRLREIYSRLLGATAVREAVGAGVPRPI
jgi:glycosyltransferase involved in cell wall biosynthesis